MGNYHVKRCFVLSSIFMFFINNVRASPLDSPPSPGKTPADISNTDASSTENDVPTIPEITSRPTTNLRLIDMLRLSENEPRFPEIEARTTNVNTPRAENKLPMTTANETTFVTSSSSISAETEIISTKADTDDQKTKDAADITAVDPSRDSEKVRKPRRRFSFLPPLDTSKVMKHMMRSLSSSSLVESKAFKSPSTTSITHQGESSQTFEEGQINTPKLYTKKRTSRSPSMNQRYKKLYQSDGSWPAIRRMKEQKPELLNVYASTIHGNAIQVFCFVSDADIIEGHLKLSDEDPHLKVDILCFSTHTLVDKMYVAKGTQPDFVYVLNVHEINGELFFTLKEQVPASLPTPPE